MANLLVIEDEPLLGMVLEEALREAGHHVCGIAATPAKAMELAERHRPELAIVDVRLAGNGDGVALARALVGRRPMIILYATGDCEEVRRRATVGEAYLPKPYKGEWVARAVDILLAADGDAAIEPPPGFRRLEFACGGRD